MTRLSALAGCTRGAAAVEFAIVASVLFALLIGTIDMGRTFYIENQISYLADQAVRRVLIDPDISDSSLIDRLRADFSAGEADDLSISVTTESVGGTDYKVVTIGFPVTLFIPNLASDTLSLSVTRRVPMS